MGYEFVNDTTLVNDANIKAYYRLEDTNDYKTSYNLTNQGTTAFNAALYNNGADCGASNSSKYLYTNNNMGITGGAITLCGWFKLYATNILQPLVMQGSATNYVGYFLYYDGNNTFGLGSGVVLANRQRQLVANNCVYGSKSPGTSSFHHYALTYNGTTLTAYYDGASVGTPTNYSGNGSGVEIDTFRIGNNAGQSGNAYGSIIADDVIIFNRALSSTEIAQVYNGVAPSSTYIKVMNGLARASVKTVDGLAVASMKTWNGLT